MSATTEPAQGLLERTRRASHPRCVVCGRPHDCALGLHFSLRDDGSVVAGVECPEDLQGYTGMVHGGVIAAIADGAMTNCLFAHGIAAVTAELNVRFRHPVESGKLLGVTARITRRAEPLYLAEAELSQAGEVKATAAGKFMEAPR
ncbi:MAG: PaaI family thioesterase [Planctomycetota bacterium]